MLVYLYMLSDQLCGSLWGYAGMWGRISEAWEPIKLFLKISSASSAVADHAPGPGDLHSRASGPGISRRAFRLPAGRAGIEPAKPIDCSRPKVGLVGRTGCGKSTLLNLVERLYDAHEGSVFVGGEDVRRWPLKKLQRMCTCLSQNGGVFFSEATLLDTIRFAKPDASFSDVVRAARLACIHDEIMNLQDGYQTRGGEHGKNLSGGQRQRVAIAQALLSLDDPGKKVVLLDECTSNLDTYTEATILRNIWPLLEGKTVVLVTHRIEAIDGLVDEVVRISEGQVTSRTPRRAPGAYAAQLQTQPVA